MKIQEIPDFMGRSATDLSSDFGIPKQTLWQYLNGQRGKPSKLICRLLIFCNLNREEIIFPDYFQHPSGEDEKHAAYWANIAIECLKEANKRGLPEKEMNQIIDKIFDVIDTSE